MSAILRPARIKGGAVFRGQFFRAPNNLRWFRPQYAYGRGIFANRNAIAPEYYSRAFFGEVAFGIELATYMAQVREFSESFVFSLALEAGLAGQAAFAVAAELAMGLEISPEAQTNYGADVLMEFTLLDAVRGRVSGWELEAEAEANVWVEEPKPKLF